MHTQYDNLTDSELMREARCRDDPLITALAERLEMRHRDLEDLALDLQKAQAPDPAQYQLFGEEA